MRGFATDLPPGEHKPHLRAFQERLAERLREAESAPRTARLGLLIGQRRWLVELAEAGEIAPIPATIAAVPLTRDWFVGLVNLRGALHAVSDLQRFATGVATPLGKDARLLALSAASGIGAALLVTRMLGLHDTCDWSDGEASGEASEEASDEASGEMPDDISRDTSSGTSRDTSGETSWAEAGAPRPAWVGATLRDRDGEVWTELSLARLACDPRFLAANRAVRAGGER